METSKTIQETYKAYDEVTPERQALYDEMAKIIVDYGVNIGDIIAYADRNIDDDMLQRYTAKSICTEYLDAEIGEFNTALDVVKYLSEECGIWEDEDLELIAIEQKRLGDIYNIGGTWYFGNL